VSLLHGQHKKRDYPLFYGPIDNHIASPYMR
jgi:hypothetical protein